MKRRIGFAAALVLLAVVLAACGGSGQGQTADMDGLIETMTAADPALPEMLTVTSGTENAEALFGSVSDMDYGKVAGYALAYSADGNYADEIVVISVKSASDVSEAEQSLRAHLEGRRSLYSTYGPEQVSRVDNALVFSKGNYAVLIISDNGQAVKDAFDRYIG